MHNELFLRRASLALFLATLLLPALPGCSDSGTTNPGAEICNNQIDDNGDGKIDCQDPMCAGSAACQIDGGTEICDNQVDEDCISEDEARKAGVIK